MPSAICVRSWETEPTADAIKTQFRAALESEDRRKALQRLVADRLAATGERNSPDDFRRVQLLAAHLMGVGIVPYLLKFSPVTDLSTEQADEQIAADTGVSVERLQHHFPTAPDLALGIIDRLYSEMMALCLRCTDGWGTQQQAQVTWRNFVHGVAGLGIGDIFPRVTPETVRILGSELRSAVLPRQQRMNR
ncbi:TetR/AcrR family transcriptional regulator [Corynebacterium variabile]|uniref:TetR/AcrR family transcriptional regulator n=1 Tax=Corynebacterium variabile TaxID=1727 RepID=UPI0028A179CA|nr:hypothetical protein [Corynebacterium variabile]